MRGTFDHAADPPAEPGSAVPDRPVRPGLFRHLWHRRLVVGVTFGVTLLTAMGLSVLLPVGYVATGSLIVAERDGAGADLVESTALLVRSPALMRVLLARPAVVGALEVDCAAVARQFVQRLRPVDCARLARDPEAQMRWVAERYRVGTVEHGQVVAATYRSPSPEAAQSMVNGLLATFLTDETAKIRLPRDQAIDWIRQRLAQLDSVVQQDAEALETFRADHGLSRAGADPLGAERMVQATRQLAEARAAQADAEQRQRDARGSPAMRQAAELRSIAELRQQLAQASAQAAGAAQRFGAQNPQLAPYRQREADLAARLAAETNRAGDGARRAVDAARERTADATRELASRTEALNQSAEAQAQADEMARDLAVKRAATAELSQRLGHLAAERLLLKPGVEILDRAALPARPAFPPRAPILIGGLALATTLATAAGLLKYRRAPTGPAGPIAVAQSYTRIPILSQIPQLRLRRTGTRELSRPGDTFPLAAALSLLEWHPPLLEAFRVLYARLTLAGFGTEHRTLLITSEMAGEGKSFVTLALARLARAAGQSVLVIETSLRDPALADAFQAAPGAGLAGFLRGEPAETVTLGAVPGAHFLLAGATMHDSTEALTGKRFQQLLTWADRFDLVLIDSAPIGTLLDAALLAPLVDGVLFCLRAGRAPAVDALNSLPSLHRAHGNVVGLTMTFVPAEPGAAPGGPTRVSSAQRRLAGPVRTPGGDLRRRSASR